MGQLTHPTAIMRLPAHETAQPSSEERGRLSRSEKGKDKDEGSRSRATSKEQSSCKSHDSSNSKSKSEDVSPKDDGHKVDAKGKEGLSAGHRIFWPRRKLGRPRSKTSPEKPKSTTHSPSPSRPVKQKSFTSPPSTTHVANSSARDRDKPRILLFQDRTRSLLDTLNNRQGDAQASPPNRQSNAPDSPIDTAVRRIQEAGCSARATALQTGGALLARIYENRITKDVVSSFVFLTCVDTFKRDPLDNIGEISNTYQLFSVLVQEGVIPVHDFVRAAQMLRMEGHPDGCRLLLHLMSCDMRLGITHTLSAGDQRLVADLARDG